MAKSMDVCIGVAARVWCDQDFSDVVMDGEACKKIAEILFRVANPLSVVLDEVPLGPDAMDGPSVKFFQE